MAAGLFALVSTLDYVRYALSSSTYQYVSRETYLLYILAVMASLLLFLDEITAFIGQRFHVELFYLLLLFFVALFGSIAMKRQDIAICTRILRSYKCISPLYILVKSKEVLFQQIIFVMMALSVSREIGTGFYGVLTFILVSLVIHIPILLHVERFWRLTYGSVMVFASVIFFYTYVSLDLFWPAVYVHAIIYTFFWVSLAEPSTNE